MIEFLLILCVVTFFTVSAISSYKDSAAKYKSFEYRLQNARLLKEGLRAEQYSITICNSSVKSEESPLIKQAKEVLVSCGYSKTDAKNMLKSAVGDNVGDLVKDAILKSTKKV